MTLKNGMEVIDESVSGLGCKQKKTTLTNLRRTRRQPVPAGNEEELCSRRLCCQATSSQSKMLPLISHHWTVYTLTHQYVVFTTSTMNSCSLRVLCLCVSIFRFKVLGRDLSLMEAPGFLR